MGHGMDLSVSFIGECLAPLLQSALADDFACLAIAVLGTGSDILELDDELSGDHHAGPRATVVYASADSHRVADRVAGVLAQQLPAEYGGGPVTVDHRNLMGVASCSVEALFERFLGTAVLPQTDLDWLQLCEVDLLHVTAGRVVVDGPGELTRRRRHLAYYPDNVWQKRLADWCMYVTGRDAPYNLHRVSRRGDEPACAMYFGAYLYRLMQLCFALNRRYATYPKWLNRLFRRLPRFVDGLAPGVDELMLMRDWRPRVEKQVELNYLVADALAALELTKPPTRKAWDEGLTDLTLYDSAMQIYRRLPAALIAPSFNQIEYWERLAREVILNPDDYFQSEYQDGA